MRVVFALILFGLAACSEPVEYTSFGAEIEAEEAMAVGDVVTDAEAYAGQTVKLAGTVREVCQNKGCWMTLDGGEGQSVRITFRDYSFFVPTDISGRQVVLEGTLTREEIPVDELRHYAEDSGKPQPEIDAITEPELQLSVIADGVLVGCGMRNVECGVGAE